MELVCKEPGVLCPVVLGRHDLEELSRFIYIVEATLARYPVSEFQGPTDGEIGHYRDGKIRRVQFRMETRLSDPAAKWH